MLFLLNSGFIYAGELYEEFPEQVKPEENYVFYSHGLIVEGINATPISLKWGLYDFPKVKEALTDVSYNLIAYHRPKDTDPKQFAKKVAGDVELLIEKGVKRENITLLGFSRGGEITILASGYLKSRRINVVLLASCPSFMKNNDSYKVYGTVLSVYETSDFVGSCQFLIDQSPNVKTFEEISISTGKEHGAFFTPIPDWVEPVKTWLKRTHS